MNLCFNSKITMYCCGICKREFNSNSLEDLNRFCDHVSKCPIRSNDFLRERYECPFCQDSFRLKKSFKGHLLNCTPPNCLKPPNEHRHIQLGSLLNNKRSAGKHCFYFLTKVSN